MNIQQQNQLLKSHLIWVYGARFDSVLDGATWLNTTNELRNLGWKITLVAAGNQGNQIISGTEVYCISCPDIYILRQIIFHLKLIVYIVLKWSSTSHILFSQLSAPWLIPLNILRILIRGKRPLFILDSRTVPMEDSKTASFRDKIRGWFYNNINNLANTCVDGQTAITQRMATKVKIPPKRLWGIWPSGADVDLFKSAIQDRRWPNKDQPIILIYVGVLHFERNLMALCKAIEMANRAEMNFHLILTGSGTEKESLQEFASHTDGRIEVNNPIPHDQVPNLLSRAHVGVLPFPDEEKYRVSSPIKLFEYMASGLAVMATRIVCHTDVIQNSSYTFWAEDSSAEGLFETLKQIWSSQSVLKEMGSEAALASQNWTWKESAIKLSNALLYGSSFESQSTSTNSIDLNNHGGVNA
jgi:glycosyltransferase involved in cell wall biosynthesis